jgi:hypothetical protein
LAVDAWKNVKKVFSFEAVKKHFTSVKNKVTEGLSGLAGKVKEKFSEAWTKVKEVFAFENVKSHFVSVKDKAVSGFTGVADNIKEKFSAAWTKIKEVFGLESVKTHFTNVKTNVVNGFTGLATSIKKKFTTAWTKVKEVFALDTVKKRFESVRNSAVNGFSGIVSSIKKKFSLAWTKVKEVFSLDTVEEHFSGIKDKIVEIAGNVKDALKSPINSIIDLINDAIDGLNTFSVTIKGETIGFDIPKIPKLATGTVVPANYGEFLAVLGDNKTETEVVSPLSTIEQAVANALAKYGGIGGGDIRIEIPFNVDGKKLHTQIVKVNKAQIRKTGNNPLAT